MSGGMTGVVAVQRPFSPFVMSSVRAFSSPLTVTFCAFGAMKRNVMVRSAPTSGDTIAGPRPPPRPPPAAAPAPRPPPCGTPAGACARPIATEAVSTSSHTQTRRTIPHLISTLQCVAQSRPGIRRRSFIRPPRRSLKRLARKIRRLPPHCYSGRPQATADNSVPVRSTAVSSPGRRDAARDGDLL